MPVPPRLARLSTSRNAALCTALHFSIYLVHSHQEAEELSFSSLSLSLFLSRSKSNEKMRAYTSVAACVSGRVRRREAIHTPRSLAGRGHTQVAFAASLASTASLVRCAQHSRGGAELSSRSSSSYRLPASRPRLAARATYLLDRATHVQTVGGPSLLRPQRGAVRCHAMRVLHE